MQTLQLKMGLNNRIQTIRKYISSQNIDCALVFGSQDFTGYIKYLYGITTKSSATYLCIDQTKEFFIEIGYMAADLKRQASCEVLEFEDENTISNELPKFLSSYASVGLVGLAPYLHLINLTSKIQDLSTFADTQLVQKSQTEIDHVTQLARSLQEVFEEIRKYVHAGLSEKELATFIQTESFKRAEKFSFPLNVVSGERIINATIGEPTDYVFKKGDSIAIDMGLYNDGYYTDATRMFFIDNNEAAERYQLLCDINTHVANSIEPGKTTIGEIKNIYVVELKKNSMPFETLEIPYLGHSIGLFLHEQPFLYQEQYDKTIIPEGMIFTLEPEISYPEYHLRVEDMYFAARDTLVKLT